jgi:hypothetical protein
MAAVSRQRFIVRCAPRDTLRIQKQIGFSSCILFALSYAGVALEAAGFVGANFLPLVDCETSVTTIGSRTPNGPGSRK